VAALVGDSPEGAPIDLRLLARCGLEAHRRLWLTSRTAGLHEGFDLALSAGVAAHHDLAEEFVCVVHPSWRTRCLLRQQGRSQALPDRLTVVSGAPGNLTDRDAPCLLTGNRLALPAVRTSNGR
jgi:hypothetical protein